MQLKTRHIIARDKKAITFMLYGIIGEKIDGDYFAEELFWAEREYDEITIRINSDGGSVSQGLSIVSAMMGSKAYIIVQVDGVAASMAATLLPAADKVRMNDYARIMIHSPYYEDENGNKVQNLSAKDKKSLESLKGILVTLLSKRGKSEEEIKKLLKTDTWFTAEEAKEVGLIDEIIVTGKKELAALAPMKLVAKLNDDEYQEPKTQTVMKKVFAKLGLPENSSEEAVLTALDKREQKLVDRYVKMGEEAEAINDDNREMMTALAKKDLDLFISVVEQLKAKAEPKPDDQSGEGKDGKGGKEAQARLSRLVKDAKAKKGGRNKEAKAKTFDWYQKNDPQALAKLEQEDPEKFEELYDEYEASLDE